MKKSKFTESQIIGILKQQDSGKSVAEICRGYRLSQPTFYQWKSKYSGYITLQNSDQRDR